MAYTDMEYGHWGITVSTRQNKGDYAPIECKTFAYPVVNGRGPMDSAKVEMEAIEYCLSKNGIVKGPFFK